MFKRIQAQKSYVYIMEQIVELVENGRLKPGDQLPSESTLTKNFGASRPTVRQALTGLEVLGIVRSQGGKGSYIQDHLDFDSLRYKSRKLERSISPAELLESRKMLETEIAQLAAVKANPTDIAMIYKSLSNFKDLVNGDTRKIDYDRLFQLDREFHLLVAKATHNAALVQMMQYIIRGLRDPMWLNLKGKSLAIPGRFEKYLSEHSEILRAIKNRNEKKAREGMYKHIRGIEKDFFD
jgi:DNA-binding FadR family transcriptional regulator